MSEGISGKNIFRELEVQNAAVADAFQKFRRRGGQPGSVAPHRRSYSIKDIEVGDDWRYPTFPRAKTFPIAYLPKVANWSSHQHTAAYRASSQSRLAFVFLLIGVIAVAIVVGPALVRFLAIHWEAILLPTGGACVGAGAVLLVSRVGTSPLRAVAPPKADTEDPLQELKYLAERTASRLQAAYRFQLWTVLAVGAIFITLILWSVVMGESESHSLRFCVRLRQCCNGDSNPVEMAAFRPNQSGQTACRQC